MREIGYAVVRERGAGKWIVGLKAEDREFVRDGGQAVITACTPCGFCGDTWRTVRVRANGQFYPVCGCIAGRRIGGRQIITDEAVISGLEDGLSQSDIARDLRVTRQAISARVKILKDRGRL
jgi:hypothetical protein